jgi:predicted nucleic acid-binding Zn ribbon protein
MVAAGDPTNNIDDDGRLIRLDKQLPDGYMQFVVCGTSMAPKGIDDGDNLVCKPVNSHDFLIKKGMFLIIKVDPNYYKEEVPIYDYKLRCAIMDVECGEKAGDIIMKMKDMDDCPEIWLPECQENLRKKMAKARSVYPLDKLVLSCTYKQGDLQYSFHKKDAVEFIAETRIQREYPHEGFALAY